MNNSLHFLNIFLTMNKLFCRITNILMAIVTHLEKPTKATDISVIRRWVCDQLFRYIINLSSSYDGNPLGYSDQVSSPIYKVYISLKPEIRVHVYASWGQILYPSDIIVVTLLLWHLLNTSINISQSLHNESIGKRE